MNKLSEGLCCAASITDEPNSPEECLTILHEYVNSPRIEAAHRLGNSPPRLTFATSEGAVVDIIASSKGAFTVHVSFEDAESPTGRFDALHDQVELDGITRLIGSSWTSEETLLLWSQGQL